MTVCSLTAADVRPLRSEVLRPGQPPDSLVYPGDDAPGSLHAGTLVDGEIVGIATVYPEPMPPESAAALPDVDFDPSNAFRLRGMATRATFQGSGLGRAVLTRCIEHVREAGADVLWCNARIGALGFYERLGFSTVGDEFDIAGIGPHYVMWKDVRHTA